MNFAPAAQGEVKIEQGRNRGGAHGGAWGGLRAQPKVVGAGTGAAGDGEVLPVDLHLEDFVSVLPVAHISMSEKCDETLLKSSEAAFDFALGLWSRSDPVSDLQGPQGALEFAFGVGVIRRGTGAEKAQSVGINAQGNAVGKKGGAEVLEMVPGGVRGNEAPGNIEARVVIEGEQEGLLLGGGPPLVDGTVVLPEFAGIGTAEAAIGARLSRRGGNELGEVCFGVGFDGGAGAGKVEKPEQFVANELVVGRVPNRQEGLKKSEDVRRPRGVVVAAAGHRLKRALVFKPIGSQLVKARLANPKLMAGRCRVEQSGVEVGQGATEKPGGQAMNDLWLFKVSISTSAPAGSSADGGRPPRRRSAQSAASPSASATLRPPPRRHFVRSQ